MSFARIQPIKNTPKARVNEIEQEQEKGILGEQELQNGNKNTKSKLETQRIRRG
jgi:hypothetical protein